MVIAPDVALGLSKCKNFYQIGRFFIVWASFENHSCIAFGRNLVNLRNNSALHYPKLGDLKKSTRVTQRVNAF